MINITALKAKRAGAGIAGIVLCKKYGMARSRLSDIERGHVLVSAEELNRIETALDDLIRAKCVLQKTAAALGWPIEEVR